MSVNLIGMSQMWSGDTQDGLEFTFRMLMIGISLAIGRGNLSTSKPVQISCSCLIGLISRCLRRVDSPT
jgi:F0F1-type ATP synthase membrane subunit c/vacuolar-type H+-ATPase subunit K